MGKRFTEVKSKKIYDVIEREMVKRMKPKQTTEQQRKQKQKEYRMNVQIRHTEQKKQKENKLIKRKKRVQEFDRRGRSVS